MAVIRFYTDGACSGNPGPGGWCSLLILDDNIHPQTGFEESTTNNRMELKAIVTTVQRIRDMLSGKRKIDSIEIYSDSAYVVNAINNNWLLRWSMEKWKTSKGSDIKNKDLWLKLLKDLTFIKKHYNNKVNIVFIKVKGHSGNTFNEYADKLARERIKWQQ